MMSLTQILWQYSISSPSSPLLMSTMRGTAFRIWTLPGRPYAPREVIVQFAFSKAVIQKNCIYCFGNHCFQFLLGFRLFSDKAVTELMAEEFIQWPGSLPGKGRHPSHLVGTQQPEMDHLRGRDSLNQRELLGPAVPANFPGNWASLSSHKYLKWLDKMKWKT